MEGWPGGPFPFKDEFYAVAKQMRPELYVLQTDGCCWSSSQQFVLCWGALKSAAGRAVRGISGAERCRHDVWVLQ